MYALKNWMKYKSMSTTYIFIVGFFVGIAFQNPVSATVIKMISLTTKSHIFLLKKLEESFLEKNRLKKQIKHQP